MRVLLDTNVLVRANERATGPARDLLCRLGESPHTLVTCPFILTELIRVLHYPRIQAQYHLSQDEIRAFADEIQQLSEVVDDSPAAADTMLGKDPDDNPILRVAARAHVNVICTRDRHFWHPDVQQYCAFHGIRIMTDIELLELLRAAAP